MNKVEVDAVLMLICLSAVQLNTLVDMVVCPTDMVVIYYEVKCCTWKLSIAREDRHYLNDTCKKC